METEQRWNRFNCNLNFLIINLYVTQIIYRNRIKYRIIIYQFMHLNFHLKIEKDFLFEIVQPFHRIANFLETTKAVLLNFPRIRPSVSRVIADTAISQMESRGWIS